MLCRQNCGSLGAICDEAWSGGIEAFGETSEYPVYFPAFAPIHETPQ